jgi:CheY-like chemotaxis protein
MAERTKLLIIDDDSEFRYALRGILEGHGYDVVEAGDGTSGLEALQREKPGLVLLDVIMPVLNGWETLSVIRGRPQWRDLPVVMLTALGGPHGILQSYGLGCTVHITKPIMDFDELAATIDGLLAGAAGSRPEKPPADR